MKVSRRFFSNPQFWLPVIIFLIALAARLLPGSRTIDDSFITYRYARNLLAGYGFVYNPGERVLGTTTPLYTFLMVALGLLGGGVQAPFPNLAMLVNALADGVTCLLLIRLGRRLGYPLAGLGAGLAWAIAPFSVTFAIGGLETSLYVLLLVAMASAHVEKRHILAAGLAALALLTRPDALILIGLLAMERAIEIFKSGQHPSKQDDHWKMRLIRQAKNAWLAMTNKWVLLELLVFFVPVLAWGVFATAYFGSPLPHSIAAKSLAYRLPPEAGFIRLLQHYTTPFQDQLTFGNLWIGVGMVIYPFLYLAGALGVWRSTRSAWPLLAYPWLYLAVFALANPLIFRWYLTPPMPFYILIILAGAERLIYALGRSFAGRIGARHKTARDDAPVEYSPGLLTRSVLVFFVVLAPAILSLRDWQIHPDHGLDRPAPSMAWYKLELLYRQVADSLAADLQNGSSPSPILAAGDVGVLGFYTSAHILDTVGLNSPQSTRYYPLDPAYYVISYAIPPDLILEAQPDYLVILEVYGREGLLKDPRFWAAYQLRQKIPTDIYGSDGMLVFERK